MGASCYRIPDSRLRVERVWVVLFQLDRERYHSRLVHTGVDQIISVEMEPSLRSPHEQIGVSVVVDVAEGKRRFFHCIGAGEPIGPEDKLRTGGCSGILVIINRSARAPHKKIGVTVVIDVVKNRLRVLTHINPGKGARDKNRDEILRGSGILKVTDTAVAFSDEQIEITVPIDVDQSRDGILPGADRIDRRWFRGEDGGGGRPGIPVELDVTVELTDEEVLVAVSVDVGKCRGIGKPSGNPGELGIGKHERGLSRGAVIAEVPELPVETPNH